MIENRFVTTESTLIDMAWWDACVDPQATPIITEPMLPVWIGVDASVKRDSTAIVAVTWDEKAKKVRLITHRLFQPSSDEPLDFELAIERTLLDLSQELRGAQSLVRSLPDADVSPASATQRHQDRGVPAKRFPTSPRRARTSTTLSRAATLPSIPTSTSVSPSVAPSRSRARAVGASRRTSSRTRSTWWYRWPWPRSPPCGRRARTRTIKTGSTTLAARCPSNPPAVGCYRGEECR